MSQRYKGGVISATPPTTSTSSASGVWTEQQFMQGVASGSWPALAGAPTIGTATAGALSASVAFTAPTYTGSGITGYTATSSPGGFTGTGASSPITVSGLTAGTAYTFTVTATTAAGQGPASAASNSVTPFAPSYIEDVYSTYLYTGNGSTQTITNGIDLSGNGGVTWLKVRNLSGEEPTLFSTSTTYGIGTNSTGFNTRLNSSFWSTTSSGFNLLSSNPVENENLKNYASWTFREQAKFFDIVTFTGTGSARTIAHNLGSVPGCIMVKRTDATGNWRVYHRYLDPLASLSLNLVDAADYPNSTIWNGTAPTSTVFSVGTNSDTNASGGTYVAYIFAHDAGGFGLTGTDNVISCGGYSGNSTAGNSVTLGFEPQWLLIKCYSAAEGSGWIVVDNMRGLTGQATDPYISVNYTFAESQVDFVTPTATGFTLSNRVGVNGSGKDYIYIAIRRGPMKVPTVGTTVFSPIATTGDPSNVNVGFPTDLYIENRRDGASNKWTLSRLTGGPQYLSTNTTNAEATYAGTLFDLQNFFTSAALIGGASSIVSYMFGRAPSFFDQVCYTGDSVASRQITHNLTVAPELVIIKSRTAGYGWPVYTTNLLGTTGLALNSTYQNGFWNDAQVTAMGVTTITLGSPTNYGPANLSGYTYVAYLFATCPGVSKVGSYTGNGSTQTINCGFTTGARFVLLKRTDAAGGWYVYDTARGMTALTDPYSFLDLGAAETATLGSVTTVSTGFALNSAILADINASGGTYIFLAIA